MMALSNGSLHTEIEEHLQGEVVADRLEEASVLLVDMGIRDVSEITPDDMEELRDRGMLEDDDPTNYDVED
jgi:hypothetical protein